MKDTAITVRLPMAVRRRLEKLAQREGRSLSGQVERLLEHATEATPRAKRRSLAGILAGQRVPTLSDFRQARRAFSESLDRRASGDDEAGL